MSSETHYPRAYLDNFPGPELADSGTITFRYRVASKEEIPAKDGKPEQCHYRLELIEVTQATLEDEEASADESAEEAMDRKLRRKKSSY